MIQPTVGRVVLFHPAAADRAHLAVNNGQPIPALICCVWSDTCINVAGFDANGAPFSRTSVLLVQDDTKPDHGYAEWMPFQKSQAPKENAKSLADAQKAPTAPRVTPEQIEGNIVGEDYYVFPKTTLTICCLTLRNGFTVTGESACASPENFDAAFGRKLARDDAKRKIWALEGYALRNLLTAG